MTSIFMNDKINISNEDCFNYINKLPDNSIDLIIIDPPYFKYLSNNWDNQWKTLDDYLAWLDLFFNECRRTLKNQGSFYCFCSNRYTGEIELLVKKHFNFLSHITWKKTTGRFKAHNKERLRSFVTASERLLFAEQKNSQKIYNEKISNLKSSVFEPLIKYFINAKDILKITAKEINEATNTQMYKHWFSYNQWELPTFENYEKIYCLFDKKAKLMGLINPLSEYYGTQNKYNKIKIQYQRLSVEYQNVRRYFNVSNGAPFTDVWEFAPVQYYQGKHPCEKPKSMIEHIINISSKEGDLVADFFLGSGRTAFSSIALNRNFTGCELDKGYYKNIIDILNSVKR